MSRLVMPLTPTVRVFMLTVTTAALGFAPRESLAQITYFNATRTVSAYAQGGAPFDPDQSQSFTTNALGLWTQGASAGTIVASGLVEQTSDLRSDEIYVSARCSTAGQNAYSREARFTLDTSFRLDAPTPWSSRLATFYGGYTCTNTATQQRYYFGDSGTLGSGVIPAGQYRLNVYGNGAAFGGGVQFIVTLPAPGSAAPFAAVLLVVARRTRRPS